MCGWCRSDEGSSADCPPSRHTLASTASPSRDHPVCTRTRFHGRQRAGYRMGAASSRGPGNPRTGIGHPSPRLPSGRTALQREQAARDRRRRRVYHRGPGGRVRDGEPVLGSRPARPCCRPWGGTVEDIARHGGLPAGALGLAAAAVKLACGILALALVRTWGRALPRALLLSYAAAASLILICYGAIEVPGDRGQPGAVWCRAARRAGRLDRAAGTCGYGTHGSSSGGPCWPSPPRRRGGRPGTADRQRAGPHAIGVLPPASASQAGDPASWITGASGSGTAAGTLASPRSQVRVVPR